MNGDAAASIYDEDVERVSMNAKVRTLANDLGFTEGPVVAPDGTVFITSLSLGKVFRIDTDGSTHLHADTGGGANGATIDAAGALYIAQTGGRMARNGPAYPPTAVGGIQRIDPDGTIDWLTRDPVSPNDLCFGPDGWLYYTDPTRAEGTRDARLWRTDPADGRTELLTSVTWWANGLAFDGADTLFVASTYDGRILRTDDLGANFEVAMQLPDGRPDGFAFDANGYLVIAVLGLDEPASIQTWSPDGTFVSRIEVSSSSMITNVAFTPDSDLIVADSSAGSAVLIEGFGTGMPLHPFRGRGE